MIIVTTMLTGDPNLDYALFQFLDDQSLINLSQTNKYFYTEIWVSKVKDRFGNKAVELKKGDESYRQLYKYLTNLLDKEYWYSGYEEYEPRDKQTLKLFLNKFKGQLEESVILSEFAYYDIDMVKYLHKCLAVDYFDPLEIHLSHVSRDKKDMKLLECLRGDVSRYIRYSFDALEFLVRNGYCSASTVLSLPAIFENRNSVNIVKLSYEHGLVSKKELLLAAILKGKTEILEYIYSISKYIELMLFPVDYNNPDEYSDDDIIKSLDWLKQKNLKVAKRVLGVLIVDLDKPKLFDRWFSQNHIAKYKLLYIDRAVKKSTTNMLTYFNEEQIKFTTSSQGKVLDDYIIVGKSYPRNTLKEDQLVLKVQSNLVV